MTEVLNVVSELVRVLDSFGIMGIQGSIALPAVVVLSVGTMRTVKLAFEAC